MTPGPLLTTDRVGRARRLLAAARAWPVGSQQVSRRNAMVACTACAKRRAERLEVEEFLAHRRGPAAQAAWDRAHA